MTRPAARALVLFAPGFEEIETVAIVDVLRRGGVSVTTASPQGGLVEGSHGIRVQSDRPFAGLKAAEFEAVVLPGGTQNARTLAADPDAQRILREARAAGRVLGAICAAPIALAAAGVIGGAAVTSHPSVAKELAGATYRTDRVVEDGKLVTSRGPGTAIEFALAIVAALVGRAQAEAVAEPMILR